MPVRESIDPVPGHAGVAVAADGAAQTVCPESALSLSEAGNDLGAPDGRKLQARSAL
jgi:hypothetical protein